MAKVAELAWQYFPPTETRRLLFDAREELTVRCMANLGFVYLAGRYDIGQAEDPAMPAEFGSDDVSYAREFGFGMGDASDGEMEESPPVSGDVFAYNVALAGTDDQMRSIDMGRMGSWSFPTAGCVTTAMEALYGDAFSYQAATVVRANLINQALAGAQADPKVSKALEEYQKCMSRAGYKSIKSPDEAMSVARSYGDRWSERREKEIPLATADAQCNQETGLRSTADRVLVAELQTTIDGSEGLLGALKEQEAGAVEAAEAALAS